MSIKKKTALIASAIAAAAAVLLFVLVSCSGVEKNAYAENWLTMQGRYTPSGAILLDEDGVARSEGFSYYSVSDGGIRVEAEALGEKSGVAATAVLTSKAKTPLDGLTVVLDPDDMVFTRDLSGRSEVISLLWSADPICDITVADHYDHTTTNGLRSLAQPTKALCVTINNSYPVYDGTQRASNLMITMIDGDFTDVSDGRTGYRWSFSARNNLSQSPNSDGTGITRPYADIDVSDGLTVAVRADAEHGFIVSVNGTDYFSSEDIAYYPNDVSDPMSPESMTYAHEDIDLSALAGFDGYVSIGFCGTADRTLGYGCTISEINGVPASLWNGENGQK